MREGDIGESEGEGRYTRPSNVSNRKEDGLICCWHCLGTINCVGINELAGSE
jgi:hypothetical protein